MKKIFIVANWKSNKTSFEANNWFQEISNFRFPISNKEIVVCPSFPFLSNLKSYLPSHKLPFKIGVQDISPFDGGAFTGAVNGRQIKEFADYVIIGHSERRKNFNESDEIVNLKIDKAFKHELMPIVCISNLDQIQKLKTVGINNPTFIVAYEPLFAIGSGTADSPGNADQMAKNIKDILGQIPVLYGGSVTPNNINSFTKTPNLNGVLVGKASLNAQEFYEIIQNA